MQNRKKRVLDLDGFVVKLDKVLIGPLHSYDNIGCLYTKNKNGMGLWLASCDKL